MKNDRCVEAYLILACLIFCILPITEAQTRRALLVGINHYRPQLVASQSVRRAHRGHFGDLDGCVNDVNAVYAIITTRFGFQPRNVLVLRDSMASRKRVLGEFRHLLVEASSPRDEVLFYYAGHGSLVRNLTPSPVEHDSIDASLVPSDSYWGASDIRSKELRRLSNDALDKGIVVTMIVDACHSGTITRGLSAPGRSRNVDPDPNPVSDASDSGPIPSDRGALVISAAQAHESAWETTGMDGADHGAFTAALIEVLRLAPVNSPASELFTRIRAIMHIDVNHQEPNFQGDQRRNKPLFGGPTITTGHNVTVPVLRVDQDEEAVQLEGGTALGIYPNTELHRVASSGTDSLTRIRIIKVHGINRSVAEVIAGDLRSIHSSDLFEIDRWSLPDEALLRVWLPPSGTFLHTSFEHAMGQLNALKTAMGSSWVDDPTEESPTHVISWDSNGWSLKYGKNMVMIGRELNPDKFKSILDGSATGGQTKLFAYMPPTEELASALQVAVAKSMGGVKIVTQPSQAHYLLVGRLGGQGVSYAWIMPNRTKEDADSISLPIRTDWLHLDAKTAERNLVADSLEEALNRLERIRGWLTLDGPSEDVSFPYTLSLKKTVGGDLISDGVVVGGERYKLVLRARSEDLSNGVPSRYFYVFILDSFGKSTLLYPRGGSNIRNHLPIVERESSFAPEELELMEFAIGKPYGVDSYFLLTSLEAIDPMVLDFQGVRREVTRGQMSGLGSLLYSIGSRSRGVRSVPSDWSIKRMTILSKEHL